MSRFDTRTTRLHRGLAAVAAAVAVQACAYGERFGADPGDGPAGAGGCQVDADCHDGDSQTIDLCNADGACDHVWVGDTATSGGGTDPVDQCAVAGDVGQDQQFDLELDGVSGSLTPHAPLVEGTVVRVSVRDSRRLRILPAGKVDEGLMLVLLSDCANAAANRVAWGRDLYTRALEPGEYYLAVFASAPRSVVLELRFLEPTSCDAAEPLEEGEHVGAVDGLADDFIGSCAPIQIGDRHRGDRVYGFQVPDGETWDVGVDLFTGGETPRHHLYLRAGCDGPDAVEIACETEPQIPEEAGRPEERIRLEAHDLEPGAYYLFADALVDDAFDLGEYRLMVWFDPAI